MECQASKVCVFRGVEYIVVVELKEGELTVEVEERATADQWRSTFDASYIEDMTQKTGNFKKFSVFVTMLETALSKQSSDVVTLDLLTYSDLELLRSRKAGAGSQTIPGARTTSILNSKRYLIVTYSVEFDRVHYPLPLPYMGKPDPRMLQQTIRQLKKEIKTLQQQVLKDYRVKEIESLKREYDRLAKEKEIVEAAFVEYKRELELTNEATAAKEVRILKGVIKNLEEDLASERGKYQRLTSKRSLQYRQLADELEEVKASERNLKARVKSLTNELAQFKWKGSRAFPGSLSAARDLSSRSRDFSTGSRGSASNHHSRDRSLDRSNRSHESIWSDRSRGINTRSRSTSREHQLIMRGRSSSLDRTPRAKDASRDHQRGFNTGSQRTRTSSPAAIGSYRSRTPSPAASRTIFDPTAYSAEKKRQLKEIELKRKRSVNIRMSGGSKERKGRPSSAARVPSITSSRLTGLRSHPSRSSSRSTGSLASSVESLSEIGLESDTSQRHHGIIDHSDKEHKVVESRSTKLTERPNNGHAAENVLSSTPDTSATRIKRRTNHHGTGNKENINAADENGCDGLTEISEIDARLNRLQEFMKANLK